MEPEHYNRIIFIHINDLQKIRFSKLEQVCDQVYVFVNKAEKTIPLALVQQLQHLGESVKWVIIQSESETILANYFSFYMGRLHDQLELEIEFAVISENTQLDHLIQFINEKGRGCIRVTRNKEKAVSSDTDLNGITWSTQKEEAANTIATAAPAPPTPAPAPIENGTRKPISSSTVVSGSAVAKQQLTQNNAISLSHKIAKETIKRLVLSGNRPAALKSLKSYILLQYNSDTVKQQLDTIIREMEKNNEIKVQNEEVIYNF